MPKSKKKDIPHKADDFKNFIKALALAVADEPSSIWRTKAGEIEVDMVLGSYRVEIKLYNHDACFISICSNGGEFICSLDSMFGDDDVPFKPLVTAMKKAMEKHEAGYEKIKEVQRSIFDTIMSGRQVKQ